VGDEKRGCLIEPRRPEAAMDERLARQARNEALIREVNERIEQVDKAAEGANVGTEESIFEFLCECGGGNAGDIGCEERVSMTISEYEKVRSQSDRFAVYPGHERAELEWVAARNERFVVVDKRPMAEPFVEDDPRGAPSQ
jgi:hypothetical protein